MRRSTGQLIRLVEWREEPTFRLFAVRGTPKKRGESCWEPHKLYRVPTQDTYIEGLEVTNALAKLPKESLEHRTLGKLAIILGRGLECTKVDSPHHHADRHQDVPVAVV